MAPPTKRRNAERIRLLDFDLGLASALSDEELQVARRYALAEVMELGRGTHDPRGPSDGTDLLGLLVLDGLLIRRVSVAHRHCGELVGAGAVLRPWDEFGQAAPLPFDVSWRVIREARLAKLDRHFLATIVHWPALIEAFTARITERAHTLAFNVAIHCLRHVHLRLLVLFWHLADRFGHVTAEGTQVPLPLSHSDLAELVGAQRPSVTVALRRLAADGLVKRQEDGDMWLLGHEPPAEIRDMPGKGRGDSAEFVGATPDGDPDDGGLDTFSPSG